jgi:hypothetical protein
MGSCVVLATDPAVPRLARSPTSIPRRARVDFYRSVLTDLGSRDGAEHSHFCWAYSDGALFRDCAADDGRDGRWDSGEVAEEDPHCDGE